MDNEKKKTRLWKAVILLLLAAIICMLIVWLVTKPKAELPAVTPRPMSAVIPQSRSPSSSGIGSFSSRSAR